MFDYATDTARPADAVAAGKFLAPLALNASRSTAAPLPQPASLGPCGAGRHASRRTGSSRAFSASCKQAVRHRSLIRALPAGIAPCADCRLYREAWAALIHRGEWRTARAPCLVRPIRAQVCGDTLHSTLWMLCWGLWRHTLWAYPLRRTTMNTNRCDNCNNAACRRRPVRCSIDGEAPSRATPVNDAVEAWASRPVRPDAQLPGVAA